MKERHRKNRGLWRAVLILLLVAAAILAVALAVKSRQEGGLRVWWRKLTGRTGVNEFYYENADGGAFTELNGGMAVASNAGLFVYDEEGELDWSRLFSWTSPAITGTADYRAAFDVGGNLVIFFDSDGSIAEITTEFPIVSADVNDLGYLTVCTEADGYYGIVTVYNALGKAIYRWSAGTARILRAHVSGRQDLAVLTVGPGGSRVAAMRLDSTDLAGEYTYPGLIIDLAYTEDGLTAVATDCVLGLSKELSERWRYDFSGRYLRSYALGRDFTALALSDFQVGDSFTALTLSGGGALLGSLDFAADPGPMAAGEGRLAMSLEGHIEVYNTPFSLQERFECDPGVRRLLFREDGAILAAGTFSAYVYGKKD